MARILINALAMGTAGGRTYAYNLAKSLSESARGHRYTLLLRSNQVDRFSALASEQLQILPVSKRIPERLWGRLLWEQFVLPVLAQRHHIDVLICMGSVDAFLASALTRALSVVVVQLNQPFKVPDLLPHKPRVALVNLGIRLSKRTADRFVAMSETAKSELCETFDIDPHRISVVYHGVALETFAASAGADEETLRRFGIWHQPYILSVSSISRFKNFHRLVEAYSLLRARLPDAPHLVIAGQRKDRRYCRQVEQSIASLGLHESVHLLGAVPHESLPAIYASSEIYVFPSLCETFGLTQLEAMASSVPVVVSNVSVMPEVCGDAAEYFDPYDPESIATAMLKVIVNRDLRDQMVERGLRRVARFSWARTAQQTLDLLEEIMHGR